MHAASPSPAPSPSPDPATAAAALDRVLMARSAPLTSGLSPISLSLAWQDWAQHLASQPGQALRLAALAQAGAVEWAGHCASGLCSDDETVRRDPRFASEDWRAWPWSGLAHAYKRSERWWDEAIRLDGLTRHHAEVVRTFAHQWLDLLSPSNLPFNPEVLRRTRETAGANLVQGAQHALDDWRRDHGLEPLQPPEREFRPGIEVATTPGAVVMRNRLVELIQYAPTTATVQAEPVLIVPSWIMKYYILDLSPHNSMVRWLTEQGHTVFILSWKNPDAGDADLGMDDYLRLGVFDSLARIAELVPDESVHACGYCLGGTLLSIAAAALARPGQVEGAGRLAPLASVSLLAAETDFSEPGELSVLIDEAQVQLLEAMMAERGFLSGRQMAGSFQFLHSRDLVWSTRMQEYLLGERSQPSDLMAWNADVTRMPARMHGEYLRRCYLHNDLAEDRYPVEGRPVSLSDIRQPLFVVGAGQDHVSPWRSVYKLHYLTPTEITFVLTSGGHNAGIVSEPGHPRREYQIRTRPAGENYMPPDDWVRRSPQHEGSWWPAWSAWLAAHSGAPTQPPALGAPERGYAALEDAPGRYVHEK